MVNLWTYFIYIHHYIIRDGSREQALRKKDNQSSGHQEAQVSMELLNQKAKDRSTASLLANFYSSWDESNSQVTPSAMQVRKSTTIFS